MLGQIKPLSWAFFAEDILILTSQNRRCQLTMKCWHFILIYTCHLNHENTSTVCVTLHTRANFDVWRWMRCWRCDGCYFWRCGFQRNQRIFLTCIGTVSSHVCGNKTAYFWWDIETVSSHVCNNRIQSPGKMILSATLMKWFLSQKPNQSISSSFCQNICKVSTYPWFV